MFCFGMYRIFFVVVCICFSQYALLYGNGYFVVRCVVSLFYLPFVF